MAEGTKVHMIIPSDLLRAFDETARSHDLTRSQAVRRLMRDYVARYGQADWLDAGPAKKKGAKR